MPSERLSALLQEVRGCTRCAAELPLGPRPVLQVSNSARILIVGQAPGTKVHATGIPFNDPSGDRLRQWMGIDRETFYDASRIALLPMAFCYPGRGRGGDLPPPPRCAATWRDRLLAQLRHVELTIALGQYAVGWHLPDEPGTLTDIVRRWHESIPKLVPMPHPSPRNNRWLRNNPWFEAEVVPWLRSRVQSVLSGNS
jgi:uracil-DNA glycosylase